MDVSNTEIIEKSLNSKLVERGQTILIHVINEHADTIENKNALVVWIRQMISYW